MWNQFQWFWENCTFCHFVFSQLTEFISTTVKNLREGPRYFLLKVGKWPYTRKWREPLRYSFMRIIIIIPPLLLLFFSFSSSSSPPPPPSPPHRPPSPSPPPFSSSTVQQPVVGPWSPVLCLLPNPQTAGTGLLIYGSQRQGGPAVQYRKTVGRSGPQQCYFLYPH